MSKKGLEFVSNMRSTTIIFVFNLLLLSIEIDFIAEKKSYKRYILKACDTGLVKIIITLPSKVVVLYI